jgi:hypothetical protein
MRLRAGPAARASKEKVRAKRRVRKLITAVCLQEDKELMSSPSSTSKRIMLQSILGIQVHHILLLLNYSVISAVVI